MLTNWITLRGSSSFTSITQDEAQWLDLRGFEDFVAWLDVRQATLGGATHVTLQYQTSPTKDEAFFTQVGTTQNLDVLVAAPSFVSITPVRKDDAGTSLARGLRFQLGVTGAPTGAWDATFRIWIAANIGATPKGLKARMPTPPLRPTGKSCSGDCQKGGSTPIAPAAMPVGNVPRLGQAGANRPTAPRPMTMQNPYTPVIR